MERKEEICIHERSGAFPALKNQRHRDKQARKEEHGLEMASLFLVLSCLLS